MDLPEDQIIYYLHCDCCDTDFEYRPAVGQSLYGAAYTAAARHEQSPESKSFCFTAGARYIRLVNVHFPKKATDPSPV